MSTGKAKEMTDHIDVDELFRKIIETIKLLKENGIEPTEIRTNPQLKEAITNIIPIEEVIPHKVSEVICVKCMKRWIDIRPARLRLKDLECPNGHVGYIIETGEELEEIQDDQ